MKTSWRISLVIIPSRRLFKMSWKTKKCYAEDVFKTSLVRLHQDILSLLLYVHCYLMFLKESWKRLEDVLRKRFEDVFKTSLEVVLQTCLEEVLGDEKLLHRRDLQDVLEKEKCLLALKYLPRNTHHVCSNFEGLK